MPESFFDTYVEGSGTFVTGDEKLAFAEAGVTLKVMGVQYDPNAKFGAEFRLQVIAPDVATGDEEERQLTFGEGKVESRNRMLRQMMEWFAAGNNEPIPVKLEKVGQSWLLRKAE